MTDIPLGSAPPPRTGDIAAQSTKRHTDDTAPDDGDSLPGFADVIATLMAGPSGNSAHPAASNTAEITNIVTSNDDETDPRAGVRMSNRAEPPNEGADSPSTTTDADAENLSAPLAAAVPAHSGQTHPPRELAAATPPPAAKQTDASTDRPQCHPSPVATHRSQPQQTPHPAPAVLQPSAETTKATTPDTTATPLSDVRATSPDHRLGATVDVGVADAASSLRIAGRASEPNPRARLKGRATPLADHPATTHVTESPNVPPPQRFSDPANNPNPPLNAVPATSQTANPVAPPHPASRLPEHAFAKATEAPTAQKSAARVMQNPVASRLSASPTPDTAQPDHAPAKATPPSTPSPSLVTAVPSIARPGTTDNSLPTAAPVAEQKEAGPPDAALPTAKARKPNVAQPERTNVYGTDPSGLTLSPMTDATSSATTGRAQPHHLPSRPDIAHHVAQQMAATISRASPGHPVVVRLNPEELGHVRLALHTGDGAVSLAIHVERSDTLDLMRRHISQLATAFRDIGYADVAFSFSSSQRDHSQPRHPTPSAPATVSEARNEPPPAPPNAQRAHRQGPNSGLDLRL